MKKGVVLLVDNEDAVRGVLNRFLLNAGYSVITCSNGRRAFREWRENKGIISLIITGLEMPQLSGQELIAYIRKESMNVPILAMSGEEESAPEGANAFLQKGFGREKFLRAVEELLEGRR